MKPIKSFECPMCGNSLKETDKYLIKCQFCDTIIVPKSSKLKREEAIYVKEKSKKE